MYHVKFVGLIKNVLQRQEGAALAFCQGIRGKNPWKELIKIVGLKIIKIRI
jgi:hypothetical protein